VTTDQEPLISLAILEDNINMLRGLCAQFDTPNFDVRVACQQVDAFVEETAALKPDVAIVDLRIWRSVDAGLQAIQQLQITSPTTRCIVYTHYDSLEHFDRALRLGVRGFVSKDHDVEPEVSLTEVVRQVAAGMSYYDPIIFGRYLAARPMMDVQDEPQTVIENRTQDLSERELQVLQLAGQGKSQQEIAADLYITRNTVKSHMQKIHNKLNVRTTSDALRVARLRGLL
jgi:DNA-binding NarL/FixJ family response regulator